MDENTEFFWILQGLLALGYILYRIVEYAYTRNYFAGVVATILVEFIIYKIYEYFEENG